MLNTELHSIVPPPSFSSSPPPSTHAPTNPLHPPPLPEPTLRLLTREIEDIIVEGKLKSEGGPLGSAWEGAVRKGVGADKPTAPPPPPPLGSIQRRQGHVRARSMSL
ncbi:hypothetical protein HYDPIDRAFT_110156 [Hydnomerulius pinastri MD-312]|nr:hypothetical protein HYDPIDRAFT_110156 [Hydnomerulius pinastri MD-312]